ncbi:DUF2269 family protein [Nitrosococcus oceani]|uniref:DUF2269 family protein n=1 Tax=Nitrosococcus oceani TaxID=1229 RepID=UPI0011970020|nr:DUF2269 family protein [Nitrosococcus oceani]GEM19563.1 hypothetical protein NONS58_09550 [Nitrosococcus oceani]
MIYTLLKFAHILGAIIIGAGLIGVWVADLRSRQLRELNAFSEAVAKYRGILRWCHCARNPAFVGFRNVDDH